MKTLRCSLLAVSLGMMAFGQSPTEKKSTPTTMKEPGAMKPLPLPKQTDMPIPPDAKNPDVRQPVHETGKERPVSGKAGKGAKTGGKASPSKTPSSATPAETPKNPGGH